MYSQESYRSLLALALAHDYEFCSFLDERDGRVRCLYLRHDVDYSLTMAVKLAEINASMGVRGTFCLLLRSQIYNLLSPQSLDCARHIHALGQHLALHYVLPSAIPATDEELGVLIKSDFEVALFNLAEIEPAFAWHNPSPELLDRGLSFRLPGFVNMYSARFTKNMPYYSDSNMRHTVTEFAEVISFGGYPDLHLLFHPLNWVAGGSDMRDVFSRAWPYVIREREQDFRTNLTYQKLCPLGMPESLLQNFAKQWHSAVEEVGND